MATGLTDGSAKWLRITRAKAAGEVKFWLSDDNATYTQLGTTVTGFTTADAFSGSSLFEVGTQNLINNPFAGKVYRAIVKNGIDGTTVLDIDTSVLTSGAATSFTATTGQTVTINRSTSGRKAVAVVAPLWLLGTDDYMEVADSDLLDFGASDSFTVLAVVRQWATTVNGGGIVTKGASNARAVTSKRWMLRGWTTDRWFGLVDDGANYAETTAANSTFTSGALSRIAMTASTTTLTPYQNGTAGTTAVRTAGDLTNSSNLQIGAIAGTYQDFELVAVAIFRRALTAAEIAAVSTYYAGRNP